jgi:hypothetical protein
MTVSTRGKDASVELGKKTPETAWGELLPSCQLSK